jgi:hypothetical protein
MPERYLQQPGIPKFSRLYTIANYAGWPLLAIYGFCMFIYPWHTASWQHVQNTWDRWQTVNAGALAFLASLLAFNISKFNENRQRERDFIAAKAFLPSTLSGIMEYCSRSAVILRGMWDQSHVKGVAPQLPSLPTDYREVFSNCIRHADPDVGSYLSNILVRLQVHEARLRDAIDDISDEGDHVLDRHSLLAYLLRLAELYVLAGNLFGFARGEELFRTKTLTWEEFRSAYSILKLEIDDFFIDDSMNLMAFTKRWLDQTQKSTTESAQ